ncbi:MAG: chromate transporter [Bacteroidales bacterium]
MIYLTLFWTYFKIGLFGFGGGYAILSLIEHEVVSVHQWVSTEEFTDIVAISQMTPGPIGINSATYIGYTVTGSVWGSFIATFATILPSFIISLLIARFYFRFRKNRWLEGAFSGIRPAAVGLIAAATLSLMNDYNFIDWISYLIFAISFIGVYTKRISPIVMIALAGGAGYLLY